MNISNYFETIALPKSRLSGELVEEGDILAGSYVVKVKIVKTKFHYPNLREEIIIDIANNQVVRVREMVADHFSFYLTTKEKEQFCEKVKDDDITGELISRYETTAGDRKVHVCRLTIKPTVGSLPRIIKKVNDQFPGATAEPDYITLSCA